MMNKDVYIKHQTVNKAYIIPRSHSYSLYLSLRLEWYNVS